jgi:ABC-type dipeptide/oligopeptide/nickel transport system permease component
MPIFWLGLVRIVIFSVYLGLFPSSGWGDWQHMFLPSVTLAAYPLAMLARLTRSTMLEEIRKDYIRTARSKGSSEFSVIYKHALRNAFIPVITMAGLQFGLLISGAILTETVFAIPGIGRLTVQAIYTRDYPIIQGTILVSAAIFAVVNLLVDISYTFLDPRIKY